MTETWRLLPGLGLALTLSVSLGGSGCGDGATSGTLDVGGDGGGSGGSGAGGGNGGSAGVLIGQGGSTDGGSTDGGAVVIVEELPDGFTGADGFGGWKVIGTIAEAETDKPTGCANILRVVARDFPQSHSDFERGSTGHLTGIVESDLGADRKPVWADLASPDDLVTSQTSFDQWYRNTDGENQPFVVDMWLEPVDGNFVFDSNTFFPLKGFGYSVENGAPSAQAEGFHFTTELHTTFVYKGDENFTFSGDDDVWVFINGKLGLDIGGVHGEVTETLQLADIATDFGLVVGESYPLDLFQAERQTSASNFRIETTLDFTDCGEILEVDVPK